MIDIELATNILNAFAAVVFFTLVGTTLFSMLRRLRLYRTARLPVPVLLRALVVLFGALVVVGGEAIMLRAAGVILPPGSFERFLYTLQVDVILIGALGYYAKVELIDLDDEEKP